MPTRLFHVSIAGRASQFLQAVAGIIAVQFSMTHVAEAAETASRPNIVYIMADDLGIGDVECFGGDRCRIDTPHVDRLAREGMRFTDAHAPASVCVPTRVAIMTGRYAWRFQPPRPSGPWAFLNPRLDSQKRTLGTMLRDAGYRTGYVGKWHLGTLMQTRDGKNQGLDNVDYRKPLLLGPVQYGFDYSFILPGSLDMYPYVFIRNNVFQGKVTAQKGWSAFDRVGPAAEDFEDWKVLDAFNSEAEQFISRNATAAAEGSPFFLYVALTSPHTPLSPSPKFEGTSRMGLYGDFVAETDACVGRVLDALDKHGLSDDTLVIFTSDHGPAPYAGDRRKATAGQLRELEQRGHYSSGIYRGYKFSVYEGGLRIPFVVRWPGVVKPQSTCDRLIGLNDVMRTASEVSGAKLTDDEAVDSVSFASLLRGASSDPVRDSMILRSTRCFVIRDGDWKLALCPGSGSGVGLGNSPKWDEAWQTAKTTLGRAAKRDDLKRAPFVQLFDLAQDPNESRNLAGDHPDVVDSLLNRLRDAIERGRTTPGPDQKNDRPNINIYSSTPKYVLSE